MKRDENLILKTSSDNFLKYLFYIVFYILIFICLICVYYYFIFNSFVKKINVLDKSIVEIENYINKDEHREAIKHYSKKLVLREIINSRIFLSNVFDIIEKNTHNEITFKDFDVFINGEVNIKGYCKTEEICAQAVLLFDSMEECDYVKLESITKEGNTNIFKIYLKLNKI